MTSPGSISEVTETSQTSIQQILRDDFSIDDYARRLMKSGDNVGEHLRQLGAMVDESNTLIKKQVLAHQTDLVEQATNIESLQVCVDTISAHIATLNGAVVRAQSRLDPLHAKMMLQTRQLENMHVCCNTVRAVARVMQLMGKLKASKLLTDDVTLSVRAGGDVLKYAMIIQELNETLADTDVTGVHAISTDLVTLPRYTAKVRTRASAGVRAALKTRNTAAGNRVLAHTLIECLAGQALLSLCHIDAVGAQVAHILDAIRTELCEQLLGVGRATSAVADKVPPMATRPGGATLRAGATAIERASVWTDIQHWCDTGLLDAHTQVHTLADVAAGASAIHPRTGAAVLTCIREYIDTNDAELSTPALGVSPAEAADARPPTSAVWLVNTFWTQTSDSLRTHFNDRLNELVRRMLQAEYPKFARLTLDALDKVDADVRALIRRSWSDMEDAYVAQSGARLLDTVNTLLLPDSASINSKSLSPSIDLSRIVKAIRNERQLTDFDVVLRAKVERNIEATMSAFVEKCATILSTEQADSTQVINKRNGVQLRNCLIVNALYAFGEQLSSDTLVESDDETTKLIYSKITHALQPLFASISDAVEAILATVHNEKFDMDSDDGNGSTGQQCSAYIRELQEFIGRCTRDHIVPFECAPLLAAQCTQLARRTLNLFLAHVTLIRPISAQGRLRLAADFAQLELALEPLHVHMQTELKTEYACVRALRAALFDPADTLVRNTLAHNGALIPYSLVIQLLVSASANDDLQSPHTSVGWSLARYIDWWQEHPSELERIRLLNGCVQAYAQRVQTRGGSTFDPVYPLLCELLRAAVATASDGA